MKFIKFLSLITLISYAPVLYSMEDNILQEQSRVPKLVDLCRQKLIEQIDSIINQQYAKPNSYEEAVARLNNMDNQFHIATFGLVDGLYNSNEIFQHCIDLIINEIWNQCQRVTGTTLDTIIHETRQNIFNRIPKELLSFIEAHFCKQKGWHVPHCLKEFNNFKDVYFSPNSSLIFVRYRDGRGELINAKTREVIKKFNNVDLVNFSPNSSLMFVKYQDGRGELIDANTREVISKFNNVYRYGVNFSPNSSLMVVRYEDRRGELIDAKTGEERRWFDDVLEVNFSPNSSLIFVKYQDGRGELIDAKSGAVIKELNNVSRVNFSLNGSLMLVGHYDSKLIEAKTGKVIKEFHAVNWFNFAPDDSLMFVKYWRSRGELIDAKGNVIRDNVDRVKFSPNGSLMVVEYWEIRGDYRIELINVKSGAVLKKFDNRDWVNFAQNGSLMVAKRLNHADEVSFPPNGSVMFVKYRDVNLNKREELIDTKSGAVIKVFNNVNYAFFSPNSSLMVVYYLREDRTELIDAKTGEVIKDNVNRVEFSPNGSLMVVGYRDGREELLCMGNFEQIIFKCALRNTLQMHREQQSNEIKQGLIILLNHSILTTFPQQVQDRLSQDIIDALKDMGLEFRGLTDVLLNNPQPRI